MTLSQRISGNERAKGALGEAVVSKLPLKQSRHKGGIQLLRNT